MGDNKKTKANMFERKIEKIITWIREKVKEAGKKGVVFGLSGGIDSAVIAVLCQRAFPEHTISLILPCESQESDIQDAMSIIKKYHINYHYIDLTPVYLQLLSLIDPDDKYNNKVARANLKPRLRMIVLYYFANIFDYLVVGTGNKSEIAIGYFTKYGDGGVDILPLGNSLKSEVIEMAQFLEIPQHIISKPPSAGLWKNQTDEGEMGFTYEQLDNFLTYGKLKDKKVEDIIIRMHQLSAHKRTRPPIPEN